MYCSLHTVLCVDGGVGGCLEPEIPNFGLKACGPAIISDLSPMHRNSLFGKISRNQNAKAVINHTAFARTACGVFIQLISP